MLRYHILCSSLMCACVFVYSTKLAVVDSGLDASATPTLPRKTSVLTAHWHIILCLAVRSGVCCTFHALTRRVLYIGFSQSIVCCRLGYLLCACACECVFVYSTKLAVVDSGLGASATSTLPRKTSVLTAPWHTQKQSVPRGRSAACVTPWTRIQLLIQTYPTLAKQPITSRHIWKQVGYRKKFSSPLLLKPRESFSLTLDAHSCLSYFIERIRGPVGIYLCTICTAQ